MKKLVLAISAASIFTLSGCATTDEKRTLSGVTGTGIGLVLANQFTENPFAKIAVGALGYWVGTSIYDDLNSVFKSDSEVQVDEVTLGNGKKAIKVRMPVNFAYNSTTVSSLDANRLNTMLSALKSKEHGVVVIGHTDSKGSDKYNQSLSEKRADSVKQYLFKSGYSSSLIRTSGMGEKTPVSTNSTKKGRAENRRVEIFIIPQQ